MFCKMKGETKMNKRKNIIKLTLLGIIMCISLLFEMNKEAAAAEISEDGLYYYIVKDNMAELTLTEEFFNNKTVEVNDTLVIPGKVGEYEVSAVNLMILNQIDINLMNVRKLVFDNLTLEYDSSEQNKVINLKVPDILKEKVEEVVFNPSCNVTAIPPGFFERFISLKRINIPYGTQKLCQDAFYGCMALEEIALPETLKIFENGCLDTMGEVKTIYYNNTDMIKIYSKAQIGIDVNAVEFKKRVGIYEWNMANFFPKVILEDDYPLENGYTFDKLDVYLTVPDETTGKNKIVSIMEYMLFSYENNNKIGTAKFIYEGTYGYEGKNSYDFEIQYKLVETPVPIPTPQPTPIPLVTPTPDNQQIEDEYNEEDEFEIGNPYEDPVFTIKKLKAKKGYTYRNNKKKPYVYLEWKNHNRVGKYIIYRKEVGKNAKKKNKKYKKIYTGIYDSHSKYTIKEWKGVYWHEEFCDFKVKAGKKYKYKVVSVSYDKKRKAKAKYVTIKVKK